MKIAVTSTGTTLESQVDPRFGRAPFIIIVDDEFNVIEAIDNSSGVKAFRGAGIQAAKTIADKKVDILLTGRCGPNAFTTLEAAGIKVGVEQSGTVREALERLKTNQVTFAEKPNAEAHW
ncbi:MAG: NifB/NifX family molybdenum-iron cluster-binding protein [Desulfomonilaceae bacterium]